MKNLEAIIGMKVSIETREGSVQVGKVTNITYTEFTLFGEMVKIPDTVIFNGDPSEFTKCSLIMAIRKV